MDRVYRNWVCLAGLCVLLMSGCKSESEKLYDQCASLEELVESTSNCAQLAGSLRQMLDEMRPAYSEMVRKGKEMPYREAMSAIAPCTRSFIQTSLGSCRNDPDVQKILKDFENATD